MTILPKTKILSTNLIIDEWPSLTKRAIKMMKKKNSDYINFIILLFLLLLFKKKRNKKTSNNNIKSKSSFRFYFMYC